MNLFLLTVGTFLISASLIGQSNGAQRTHLAVYYESLCPDSRRFITTQLYPLMSTKIGQHVDLELIPYGKARTSQSGDSYTFSCQHGADECEGNKLHACALKYLSKKEALAFIACSMNKRFDTGESCARELGLDSSKLMECKGSKEGSELLANYGVKTKSLNPSMYYVPWIVFDDRWTEDRMDRAQSNLSDVVCEMIGHSTCAEARENRGSRRVRRNANSFSRRRRF